MEDGRSSTSFPVRRLEPVALQNSQAMPMPRPNIYTPDGIDPTITREQYCLNYAPLSVYGHHHQARIGTSHGSFPSNVNMHYLVAVATNQQQPIISQLPLASQHNGLLTSHPPSTISVKSSIDVAPKRKNTHGGKESRKKANKRRSYTRFPVTSCSDLPNRLPHPIAPEPTANNFCPSILASSKPSITRLSEVQRK